MYTVYIGYKRYEQNIQKGVKPLEIIIKNSIGKPIYEQIYSQIKAMIVSDELKSGDMLPSIRSLAKDLRISIITTKRAYEELERDGYIYTVASKGCYVAEKNMEIIRESHLKEIEEHMQKITELAGICGLSKEDIKIMIDTIWEEN